MPTTDRSHRPGRTAGLCAVLTAVVLLASCAHTPTGVSDRTTTTRDTQGTTTDSTTTTSTTTSTTTTTAPGGTSSGALVLRDVGDGRSVTVPVQDGGSTTVPVGDQMTLVLTSTYWTIDPLPDSSVLTLEDGPTTTPQLGHCIAGQGCGTVTATYATVAPGTVALTADRTTCGEALACPVAQRHFRVVVTVR